MEISVTYLDVTEFTVIATSSGLGMGLSLPHYSHYLRTIVALARHDSGAKQGGIGRARSGRNPQCVGAIPWTLFKIFSPRVTTL